MSALELLPWPWCEDVLAAVFVAKAFIRPSRLREALVWARAQPGAGTARARWRLALACCAHHGRVLARSALLGMRSPDVLRRHLELVGEEHLATAEGRAILLGFHVGPGGVPAALSVSGHPVAWVGGRRASRSWLNDAWRPVREASPNITSTGLAGSRSAVLYRARRHILDGGSVFIAADGQGRDAFAVPVPGGQVHVKSGWHVLRRQCGVPVLPVLSHLEGRTHILRVHAPLPPVDPDPARDLAVCWAAITPLLHDYVLRYPEQCYALTFPGRGPTPSDVESTLPGARPTSVPHRP
jgi:lauroyl/myristoyl acyltransferase